MKEPALPDREFAAAARAVEGSALFRQLERAIAQVARDLEHSRFVNLGRQLTSAFSRLDRANQSATVGVCLLVAAVVNGGLAAVLPAHVLPLWPFLTPVVVAGFALYALWKDSARRGKEDA